MSETPAERARAHSTAPAPTEVPVRWSKILLWPGFILLGVNAVVAIAIGNQTQKAQLNGLTRLLVASSVVPVLCQALLIAGFIALVLEHHSED